MPVAIGKILLFFALLVALGEVPNAGKTLIQPFRDATEAGAEAPEPKEQAETKSNPADSRQTQLGQSIASYLHHSLVSLQEALRPDTVLLKAKKEGEAKSSPVAPGGGPGALDAALTRTSDMELGGFRIPLQLVVSPIQIPARWLLGVRVVHGSFEETQRHYILLAASSYGSTWKAYLPKTEILPENYYPECVARGGSSEGALESADAASLLAEQLAFGIVSTDPALAPPGMTGSWDAFQPFQEGLRYWRRFETDNDYDSLSQAIACFREATRKDRQFALAFYRLGLAFRQDGQPAAAVEAFRSSQRADPQFAAGFLELAATLYFFDTYRSRTMAVSPPPPSVPEDANAANRREAGDLLRQVLRLPGEKASRVDLAVAYEGLCLQAKQSAQDAAEKRQLYRAYYFCKRAESAYAGLPSPQRASPYIREGMASVMNNLGVLLYSANGKNAAEEAKDWHCLSDIVDDVETTPEGDTRRRTIQRGPYGGAALRYFERASALQPDDQVILCNAANAAYVLGKRRPMEALEARAEARLSLADRYAESAKNSGEPSAAARFFKLALDEYDQALKHHPSHVNLLNSYAYTFWIWRVKWPASNSQDSPDWATARKAEDYARRAVTLAADNVPQSEEVQIRSTLGEVLLGFGRVEEAIEILEKAESSAPKHPLFDEIRWTWLRPIVAPPQRRLASRFLWTWCAISRTGRPSL